jgi:hypothetical protein
MRSTSGYYRFITAGRWALPTENERHARRLGSTMAELRTFYDAVLPRIDALAYLNDFPLDSPPTDARALLHRSPSLAEVAPGGRTIRATGGSRWL